VIEVQGQYANAKVYTNKLEKESEDQIRNLCNQEFAEGAKIRIMPDVHSGKGCVIGLTMTITDKIVPNLVGVDLGCGISGIKIKEKRIDFARLEKIIKENIPSGFAVRKQASKLAKTIALTNLRCFNVIDNERALKSVGTLGGGNHFLEAGRDKDSNIWLFVHSGSRHLGNQIAQYYQNLAVQNMKKNGIEIEDKNLAYVTGEQLEEYLHDVDIAQKYALVNREAMLNEIIDQLQVMPAGEVIHTVHNYIDVDLGVVRKGAIRSLQDEVVLIPMNMRDGMLLCRGKGNPDWNFSAPHGAGRIMSRTKAKNTITFDEFRDSMAGVWSQSVVKSTMDEAPMVYKPMEEIITHIGETVEVLDIIKPIYNFKAR
jgi:RNA-splicing ligase RtcB